MLGELLKWPSLALGAVLLLGGAWLWWSRRRRKDIQAAGKLEDVKDAEQDRKEGQRSLDEAQGRRRAAGLRGWLRGVSDRSDREPPASG